METKYYDTQVAFVQAAVAHTLSVICSRKGEQTRIALSGGSTPAAVFRELANEPILHSEHVTFYQVDERYVPANDLRSNHRLITENLLEPAGLDRGHLVAFDTTLPIEAAVEGYAKTIRSLGSPTFHLALLGIGPDGHTASLFPASATLQEEAELTAHTTTDTFEVYDRLTLTYPAILSSERLLILMSGATKRPIIESFERATVEDYAKLPAAKLKSHPSVTLLFADIP